jgi:hypothetical protein
MANEIVTRQELENAHIDAGDLQKFISGSDIETVISRLGRQYPTLANAVRQIYEKGGKFYPTLALANADIANIRTDVYVITGDNGAYYKATSGATSLTKSPYDPAEAIKPKLITTGMFNNIDNIKTHGLYVCDSNAVASEISGLPVAGRAFVLSVITKGAVTRQDISHLNESFTYTRTSSVAGSFPAFGRLTTKTESEAFTTSAVQALKDSLVYESSLNMFNPANAVTGYRLNNSGQIGVVTGAKHSGFIPVISNEKMTISWSNSVSDIPFYAFFAEKTDTTPISYSTTSPATSPLTITVPANAKYIVVNLKHNDTATERTNFQVESGGVATTYKPWASTGFKLWNNLFSKSIVRDYQFAALQDSNPKIYEKTSVSRNLFNEAEIQNDKLLSSVNGGISASAGWKISGFMPVVAGNSYTLSGTRARQGVSFFNTTNPATNPALSYDNTTTLPLTVTAPAGATYAVIALESSTAKGWDKLQFEEGVVATEYIEYGKTLKTIDADYIDGLDKYIPKTEYSASIKLTSGQGSIKAGKFELGVKVFNDVSYLGSAVFNFVSDSYGDTQIRVNGDDAAPVRMMGATVGANHGYARSNVTLAAHGKTVADVGSVWTDGTNQWVIVQINSVNVIGITCRDKQLAYSPTQLLMLTHVSGATNTASFKPTAATGVQWYPMLKNHKVSVIADNKLLAGTAYDQGYNKNLKVSESYDLMEKNDIAEWLILNGGKEVKSYSATSALNVSNVHSFDVSGGDTIYANFFTHKALSAAQDLMFTQAARLKTGINGSIKYYVPRSVAFTHETVAYDFSKPTVVDGLTITARIDFDTAKTEAGKAVPDRLVMLNNNIGFAIGYLPILDASPDVRNSRTSKGIQISNSEAKVYPYLVDGLTTLPAGANYSCVAYRKYFERPTETRRIAQYIVESDFGDFMFLDWDAGDFVDSIDLPEKYNGKSFDIIESTSNATILNKVATNAISVKIGTVTSNARLIIKFSK